jgi:hypothetical protein
MRQISIAQMLVATFWIGVAIAGCLYKTNEPYGIVVAGTAIAMAVAAVIGPFRSTARATATLVGIMLFATAVIGLAFAFLGR